MIIIVLNITVIVDLLIASTRPIMFTILTWKKLQSINFKTEPNGNRWPMLKGKYLPKSIILY